MTDEKGKDGRQARAGDERIMASNERIASTREIAKEYREILGSKELPVKSAPLPPPPLIGKPVETSTPPPAKADEKK